MKTFFWQTKAIKPNDYFTFCHLFMCVNGTLNWLKQHASWYALHMVLSFNFFNFKYTSYHTRIFTFTIHSILTTFLWGNKSMTISSPVWWHSEKISGPMWGYTTIKPGAIKSTSTLMFSEEHFIYRWNQTLSRK